MKIYIPNNERLLELYPEYNLKLGAKVHKLIIAILERHNTKGVEDIRIYVNPTLLADSYSVVPAMLARSIAPHVSYLNVQCFLKNDVFEIVAGDVRHPSSFRAMAIAALLSKNRFVARMDRIPKTYKARPNLLAQAIAGEVTGKIATIAKSKCIIWKLTKKEE